jgi:hypothetical protein
LNRDALVSPTGADLHRAVIKCLWGDCPDFRLIWAVTMTERPMAIESLSVLILMDSFDNFPPQARHPRMIPQATVSRKNDLNFIIVMGYAMKVPFE